MIASCLNLLLGAHAVSTYPFFSSAWVLQDVIQSMKTFSGFSNMRKLMMEVVAFTLTTTQITAIKDVFEDMDKGNDSDDEPRK